MQWGEEAGARGTIKITPAQLADPAVLAAGVRRLTPDRVRQWVVGAQRGAMLCYADGLHATNGGRGVAEAIREIAALGYVACVQRRVGPAGSGRFLYLAQRTARSFPKAMKP